MSYGKLPRFSVKPVASGTQSTCEVCGHRRVLGYYDGKRICHSCEQDIRDAQSAARDVQEA